MSRVALPLILLAVATIYGLYRLSYAFEHLQHELGHYNRQILANRQEVAVLHAEWAYLSRPAEVARLTAEYMTDLQPLSVKQIIKASAIARLPARLPPPPVPLALPSPDAFSPTAPSVAPPPPTAALSGAGAEMGAGADNGLRLAERVLGLKAGTPPLRPAHAALTGGAR